jgi:hypothetical protein
MKVSLECMSVTIQEQSQKMEELCEEIEVLIDMKEDIKSQLLKIVPTLSGRN